MELVSGRQRSGRREAHARHARAQARECCCPVDILTSIHRLDDQPYSLLLSEAKLVDGPQDSLRKPR